MIRNAVFRAAFHSAIFCAALCAALAGQTARPDVRFTDITAASGVSSFTHVSGSAAKDYIIEATGSGVAVWDFDNDGLLDIYLVNGGTIDALRRGTAQPRAALFRNTGRGTFRDVTAAAGVGNERWGQGVCAGDIDNDGDQDLYVTNFGKNRLYRSAGGRTFEDVAVKAGVAVDSWSTGCAFGDYDGDGWLDLYVAGYVTLDVKNLPPAPSTPAPSAKGATASTGAAAAAGTTGLGAAFSAGATVCRYRGEPVMCGPGGLPGAPDQLFRNNRDGTFTDVTRAAGVEDTKGLYGFGVAWVDLDDDGKLDLIVANDSGPNHVYRNLGNGTFEDVSYASGAALDANGRAQAHMGIAVGDYDNDGRADLHITNFADDYNVLYRNLGGFTFNDVSFSAGLAQVTMPFLGWGTNFLDADNDGWQDLLVVNGHVYPAADRLPWNTSYAQRALLFRNPGVPSSTSSVPRGATAQTGPDLMKTAKALSKEVIFEEIGASTGDALSTRRASRGSATGDLDNDGALDIVINNLDGPPAVVRNAGGAKSGHWLQVTLTGDPGQKCPKDAIGSVVFVTAGGVRRRGEVASGRGQISQSALRVHFGLGPDAKAAAVSELQVRWANGPAVTYRIDRIDTLAAIDQKSGTVTYPSLRQ